MYKNERERLLCFCDSASNLWIRCVTPRNCPTLYEQFIAEGLLERVSPAGPQKMHEFKITDKGRIEGIKAHNAVRRRNGW